MPLQQPRDVAQFTTRAVNSMRLAIELFNRPHDEGRAEGVLILSLHAHEMLAKAILRKRRRRVWVRRDVRSISFEKCLIQLGTSDLRVVDDNTAITLRALNNLRDAAQHYIIELSEQELYVQIQSAVTAFDRLLRAELDQALADHLPTRVLPVSTDPPRSMEVLLDRELTRINELLAPGRRRTAEAKARLRSLLAVDLAAAGQYRNASPLEVDRAAARLQRGRAWADVLPNLASLSLDAAAGGQALGFRIVQTEAAPPVRFAESEDDLADAAIIREVDRTTQFPFLVSELARLTGLTGPKTTAVVWRLNLKSDPECSTTFTHGRSSFVQYNHQALRRIRQILNEESIDEIWAAYKARDRPEEIQVP